MKTGVLALVRSRRSDLIRVIFKKSRRSALIVGICLEIFVRPSEKHARQSVARARKFDHISRAFKEVYIVENSRNRKPKLAEKHEQSSLVHAAWLNLEIFTQTDCSHKRSKIVSIQGLYHLLFSLNSRTFTFCTNPVKHLEVIFDVIEGLCVWVFHSRNYRGLEQFLCSG